MATLGFVHGSGALSSGHGGASSITLVRSCLPLPCMEAAHARPGHPAAVEQTFANSAPLPSCPCPPCLLQEVYGKLEDPDGLQGLVRLRQDGPRPEDQRLAAEKAGNWSEALTLYEQALQHSGGSAGSGRQAAGAAAAAGLLDGAGGARGGSMAGPGEAGLGAMQRGYLDCLLHMGHLQGLLTQASPSLCRCVHCPSFLEGCGLPAVYVHLAAISPRVSPSSFCFGNH